MWIFWIAILVILFIGAAISEYRIQKQDWNRGECSRCKTPWTPIEVYGLRGRSYICNTCGSYTYVTWKRIDHAR